MQIGRVQIYTDVEEITSDNIISVLQDAFAKHTANQNRCNYLLAYEAGEQPLTRPKKTRKDIDIQLNDNLAHEATAFNEAFHWGNPITFVQRGVKDSGNDNETEAIALLNECYSNCNAEAVTQELGHYIEICGIGYIFIDINMEWEDGESYFTYNALKPQYTFVVRSSKLGHKVMLGVTYCEDTQANKHFTCFTKSSRFEITAGVITNGKKKRKDDVTYGWSHGSRSGELNPLGMIPIIECTRSVDRMGCFEREIKDMNALNLLQSDICNATDETVQAIWHANDVDFAKNEDGTTATPEHNTWVMTQTTRDGKTPFITPLNLNFDYAGNLQYVANKRAYILEKLCIPSRNDNSGGSTGVAMNSATGWNAAENAALAVENLAKGWKMEEVKVVLAAIRQSPYVPTDSPLLTLRAMDVKPSIKRSKNYELTVKSNAFATFIKNGIKGIHALNLINAFDDNNQVWADSKDTIEAIQRAVYSKENNNTDSNMSSDDTLAQIDNSPTLDKSRS